VTFLTTPVATAPPVIQVESVQSDKVVAEKKVNEWSVDTLGDIGSYTQTGASSGSEDLEFSNQTSYGSGQELVERRNFAAWESKMRRIVNDWSDSSVTNIITHCDTYTVALAKSPNRRIIIAGFASIFRFNDDISHDSASSLIETLSGYVDGSLDKNDVKKLFQEIHSLGYSPSGIGA